MGDQATRKTQDWMRKTIKKYWRKLEDGYVQDRKIMA